jgi:hypothetical protein
MLEEAIQRAPQIIRAKGNTGKIHTLHGLLHGRAFEGQFESQAKAYRFSFAPTSAAIGEHRLVLKGRFTSSYQRQRVDGADLVSINNVVAKLVATQGGVGAPPPRRSSHTGTGPPAASSDQKLEQDQGPGTELQPGLHAFANPKYDELGRPIIDATGPLSFVGVLYFVLVPLDSSAFSGLDLGPGQLGLTQVQLGGRLAPTDDLGRELQVVFSDLVVALQGERPDEQVANEMVARLNRIFGA